MIKQTASVMDHYVPRLTWTASGAYWVVSELRTHLYYTKFT